MKPENCNSTSKDDRSQPRSLSGVKWWEERMLPSRQRNMTQSQRDSLARSLRALRRATSKGTLVSSPLIVDLDGR